MELKFNEKVDLCALKKIASNIDELFEKLYPQNKNDFDFEKRQINYETFKTNILNLYSNHKDSEEAEIKYTYAKNTTDGRLFSKGGLQNIKKELKATLAHKYYFDIDIVNCHPVMELDYCIKNKIPCTYLKQYVNNRDAILEEVMTTLKYSRDDAKTIFLILINNGDIKQEWLFSQFVQNFEKEQMEIRKRVMELEPEYVLFCKNNKRENKKKENIDGRVINKVMCRNESIVIKSIIEYCENNNLIVGVLMHDGLMIEKTITLNQLDVHLKKMEEYVFLNTKIKINLITKSMDPYIINLDSFLEKKILNMKDYKNITKDISNIKKLTINIEHLDQNLYNKNKDIIIESKPGTGKTTSVAKYVKSTGLKCISLVARISLCHQHIESFKKEGVSILSYENIKDDDYLSISNNNVVCSINSLFKKYRLCQDDFFNDKILFIDEIDSFIESITHNSTLKESRRQIFALLMRMVINCKKIIVSSAIINDNVFTFLRMRNDKDKIYIVNKYVNPTKINAFDCSEEEFLNVLLQHCKDNKPFLFGSNSKNKINSFFNYCTKNLTEDEKKDYILITSDSHFQILNASEQFKNKKVFYSPSITYGVDFQIDEKQDVFYYYDNIETVMPNGAYQQLSRTRNIDNLYFRINVVDKYLNPKYKTFQKCKTFFRYLANAYNTEIYNMCSTIEEDTFKESIQDNLFFELYTYTEYIQDIYHTNFKNHFFCLLEEKGFEFLTPNIKIEDEFCKITKEDKIEFELNFFEEFLKDKDNKKFKNYRQTQEKLNIPDEQLIKFKTIFTNPIDKYESSVAFLCEDNYLTTVSKVNKDSEFLVSLSNDNISKIHLLKNVMNHYNTSFLNLKICVKDFKPLDSEFFKVLKKTYNYRGKNPQNENEMTLFLFNISKKIAPFYKKVISRSRKARSYEIQLDYEYLQLILDLHQLSNVKFTHYSNFWK